MQSISQQNAPTVAIAMGRLANVNAKKASRALRVTDSVALSVAADMA